MPLEDIMHINYNTRCSVLGQRLHSEVHVHPEIE